MKRNYSIISFLFGLTVFSTILFQSVHSFHHLIEVSEKEKCHHAYSENQSQITHSHDYEHCFSCEFTFSSTDVFKPIIFSFENILYYNKSLFYPTSVNILFFSGSSNALRGPPTFFIT